MRVLLEKTGLELVLEDPPVATGGEATLHRSSGRPNLLFKVYHKPTPELAEKLAAMLAAPPHDPTVAQGHVSIAWPMDRVLSPETRSCVGYVMAHIQNAALLLQFYNPKERARLSAPMHWGDLLRMARNLAGTVEAIHKRGYVIGDVSAPNILGTSQGLVTLVDTASFQVPGEKRIYYCAVGTPEYTPPELQGKRLGGIPRTHDQDAFGLAVLIFQLLMQGTHPFAGRCTGDGEPGSLDQRIAAGHWPYVRKVGQHSVPYEPGPFAPPVEILPGVLRRLLYECFVDGYQAPPRRPGPTRWHEALLQIEQELGVCPINQQHLYHQGLAACPWCALHKSHRSDPFPPSKVVEKKRKSLWFWS